MITDPEGTSECLCVPAAVWYRHANTELGTPCRLFLHVLIITCAVLRCWWVGSYGRSECQTLTQRRGLLCCSSASQHIPPLSNGELVSPSSHRNTQQITGGQVRVHWLDWCCKLVLLACQWSTSALDPDPSAASSSISADAVHVRFNSNTHAGVTASLVTGHNERDHC